MIAPELLAKLATLGLREPVDLPVSEQACRGSLARLESRLEQARTEFEALVKSRAGNDKTRDEVTDLLMHWFIHGRTVKGQESFERRTL